MYGLIWRVLPGPWVSKLIMALGLVVGAALLLWFFAFPVGFMAGSFISGRIGANRSIEFMTILGGVVGVANGALLVGWLYFGGLSMAALYIPGMFVSLAQGLSMPYAQAGAMAVDTRLAGSASGAEAGRGACGSAACWRSCLSCCACARSSTSRIRGIGTPASSGSTVSARYRLNSSAGDGPPAVYRLHPARCL